MKPLTLLLFSLYIISSSAQRNVDEINVNLNLNEIAILNIEPSNTMVVLNLETPNNPGEKAKITSVNNKKWINFSSAITENSPPRNLSIKIEDGSVPSGIYLKLLISNYMGSGKGQLGASKNMITLNRSSQVIISDIGGAFTGNGINNGYEIIYFLEIYDYKLLDVNNSETLSISLTLTDF
jgi:hypothetical protein